MKQFITAFLVFAISSTLFSQDIIIESTPQVIVDQDAPEIWDNIPYNAFSKSTVRIVVTYVKHENGSTYKGHGSGVVIQRQDDFPHPTIKGLFKGFIATCNHVVPPEDVVDIKVEYQSGSWSSGRVVSSHSGSDVALVECWVPKDVEARPLATSVPRYGEVVSMCGYGNIFDSKKPRYFKTTMWRSTDSVVILKDDAIPGDSGGPVFNSKGEVVGLVSAGRIQLTRSSGVAFVSPAWGPTMNCIKVIILKKMMRDHNYPEGVFIEELKEVMKD